MANWIDYVSLIFTLFVVAAAGYTFFVVWKAISGAVESTKDSLKSRGIDVSEHGLSVKTNKRLDREHYLDATQRGFIKAMKASSAGRTHDDSADASTSERAHKSSSSHRLRSRGRAAVDDE